jgi:hypothetical protein
VELETIEFLILLEDANKPLKVNGTNAEATETDTLNSFDSDGFTLGADTSGYGVNDISGNNTVSWNWLASNTTASNTQGEHNLNC